ncbi:MAG: hypothetical protein ACXVCP_13900 [Bdellovibrio sp.]
MRFLLITISFLFGSLAMADHTDFNAMINDVAKQERRLHKKLLHALQNTKTAIAYNDRWQQISNTELANNDIAVRLIRTTK